MSIFNVAAVRAALDAIRTAGEPVTVGTDPPTDTHGVIGTAVDLFGDGAVIGDDRHFVTLALSEVSDLSRGVTVTDEAGKGWALVEEMPGTDQWVARWTLEPT